VSGSLPTEKLEICGWRRTLRTRLPPPDKMTFRRQCAVDILVNMPFGYVSHFDTVRGFGFIDADGVSYFLHATDRIVLNAVPLIPGTAVVFDEGTPVKGPRATHVRIADAHEIRESKLLLGKSRRRQLRPRGVHEGHVCTPSGQTRKIGSRRDNQGHR